VAKDILGKSGRDMIVAMINGEEDSVTLSELARRSLKKKNPELRQALKGLMGRHQKLMCRCLIYLSVSCPKSLTVSFARLICPTWYC